MTIYYIFIEKLSFSVFCYFEVFAMFHLASQLLSQRSGKLLGKQKEVTLQCVFNLKKTNNRNLCLKKPFTEL